MSTLLEIEVFQCPRIRHTVRLTREACGRRYKAAHDPRRMRRADSHRMEMVAKPSLFECEGCAIGDAHAAGERPDVELARLVARPSPVEVELEETV